MNSIIEFLFVLAIRNTHKYSVFLPTLKDDGKQLISCNIINHTYQAGLEIESNLKLLRTHTIEEKKKKL